MSREELISRLEELCKGAQAVELDSYVIRTVVERLRDGLDLQRQLEQVQDQLTLKPSVAKKLNAKITGLESELTVLRSSTKVDSMEKKIQKLEVELKQSYATKNFTVKSGLLEIEKAYSDFIRSHKDVQALWGEIMLLLVEDKDGLPTSTVAQRRAAMNNSSEQAAEPSRTPRDSRSSLSTYGELVSVSEDGRPPALPDPDAILASTRTSNPPSDDGEGSSGGGALHVNSSSYVQSQVHKFKDASAPNSANLSGNSTPLRSASFYQSRLDGRTSDSAPDIFELQSAEPHLSFEERSGLFRPSVHAASDVHLPAAPHLASGLHPPTAGAAAQMLRPTSLLTAAGHVDASALEQHASHFLLSISQLKELYRGFSYSPNMPGSGNATPGASSDSKAALPCPPAATDVEAQMESLIVSVEQMKALFAQTGGSIPFPHQPGPLSSPVATPLVAADATSYGTQAEAALQSIQHLRDIFKQAQVAHSAAATGQSKQDGESREPDARYFDKQVETLLSSVASLQTLFAASHSPHTHTVGPSTLSIIQQQKQPSPSPLPDASSCTHPTFPSSVQDPAQIVHLLASFLNQLDTQGIYPASTISQPQCQSTVTSTKSNHDASSPLSTSGSHQPPSIEQLLQLFSAYLVTGQATPIHLEASTTTPSAVSAGSNKPWASPEAGTAISETEVDVAGAVARLLQLPQEPCLAHSPLLSVCGASEGASLETLSSTYGTINDAAGAHTAGSSSNFAAEDRSASGSTAAEPHAFGTAQADGVLTSNTPHLVCSTAARSASLATNSKNLPELVDTHSGLHLFADTDLTSKHSMHGLLSQLRLKHSSLLDTSPAAEALLQDALLILSLSQPLNSGPEQSSQLLQSTQHAGGKEQLLRKPAILCDPVFVVQEAALEHMAGLTAHMAGDTITSFQGLVGVPEGLVMSPVSPESFTGQHAAPVSAPQSGDDARGSDWTADFPHTVPHSSAFAALIADSADESPDTASSNAMHTRTSPPAASAAHSEAMEGDSFSACLSYPPVSAPLELEPEAGGATALLDTAVLASLDDTKMITLGEPVSPSRGSPRHPSRRGIPRPRKLHQGPTADYASEISQTDSEASQSEAVNQGPPAKRMSLSHAEPNIEPGSSLSISTREASLTHTTSREANASAQSTPEIQLHSPSSEEVSQSPKVPSPSPSPSSSGPSPRAVVQATFPESLAVAYQLAGMQAPSTTLQLPVSTSPSYAVSGGRSNQSSVDWSPSLGVVVDDDLSSGLSHLREAKAALTEKVIAYEALIMKLSTQMRAATEKGDDVGGRVMALTTEMDALAKERVALDRRLQEFQEENTIITSELIVKKMSLAQLTEEHEKLKKAHRETQSKEQIMLMRVAELERLLSVVNPDETVQLDSSYLARVRLSTSGLDNSSDYTPTAPLHMGPDVQGFMPADSTGGSSVSILDALRVSAISTYTDDSRHLPARAGQLLSASYSNGDVGYAGSTGGSSGSSSRTGTPGRRRNLSVVPEEVFGTGSPTGQEGAAASVFMPPLVERQQLTEVSGKDRVAR